MMTEWITGPKDEDEGRKGDPDDRGQGRQGDPDDRINIAAS